MRRFGCFCLTIFVCCRSVDVDAADWLQFRGTDSTSVVADATVPTEWTADSVQWKTSLEGRAVSGVIVVDGHVIATSTEGDQQDRLHVWCLDSESGLVRWKRSFWATGRTQCHPLTAMAAPTPASDGESVYALFGSNDLVCLDLDGNLKWLRGLALDFPYAFDDRGLASSPLVIGDTLIVQVQCQGDSFAAGFDTANGALRWQLPLAKTTTWTSPLLVNYRGTEHAMIQTSDRLMLIEPASGSIRWQRDGQGSHIPSPTVADQRVYLPDGGALTALKLPDENGEAEFVWQDGRLGPQSASPVVGLNRVFVVRSPNILVCGNADNGEVLWRERLRGERFWATPVLVGKHLYLANSDGVVFVVDVTGEQAQVVGENDLGESVLGSPAVADNAIYFRSVGAVWRVGG